MNRNLCLCFLLTGFLAGGCHRKNAEAPRLEAFPVHAQKVSPGTVEDTITLVGSIKARDEEIGRASCRERV